MVVEASAKVVHTLFFLSSHQRMETCRVAGCSATQSEQLSQQYAHITVALVGSYTWDYQSWSDDQWQSSSGSLIGKEHELTTDDFFHETSQTSTSVD